MTTIETIRAKRSDIYNLAAAYNVANIRIFGSVSTGEDDENSDIDFLVTALPGCTYFKLGGFLVEMQEMFNRKVDVVSDKGISKYLKSQILQEAIPL